MPMRSRQGMPLHCESFTPRDLSLIFETVARSVSIQTQDISLHLWSLTTAAPPKRIRSNTSDMLRDSRAVGELLKSILGLSSADKLNMIFEAKYIAKDLTRCAYALSLCDHIYVTIFILPYLFDHIYVTIFM